MMIGRSEKDKDVEEVEVEIKVEDVIAIEVSVDVETITGTIAGIDVVPIICDTVVLDESVKTSAGVSIACATGDRATEKTIEKTTTKMA